MLEDDRQTGRHKESFFLLICWKMTDRQAETDRQTGRDRQADRQTQRIILPSNHRQQQTQKREKKKKKRERERGGEKTERKKNWRKKTASNDPFLSVAFPSLLQTCLRDSSQARDH